MEENAEMFTCETKCRRCGTIYVWEGSNNIITSEIQHQELLQSMIDRPRRINCNACGKMTVQDVIAY